MKLWGGRFRKGENKLMLQTCYKNAQSLIILGGGAIMKLTMEVYPYIKIK